MAGDTDWRARVSFLVKIAARPDAADATRVAMLTRAEDDISLDDAWACTAVAEGWFAAQRHARGHALLRRAEAAARASLGQMISRDRECVADVAAAHVTTASPRRLAFAVRQAVRLALLARTIAS